MNIDEPNSQKEKTVKKPNKSQTSSLLETPAAQVQTVQNNHDSLLESKSSVVAKLEENRTSNNAFEFNKEEEKNDRAPSDFNRGNLLDQLDEPNKDITQSLIESNDDLYKQRIRDLYTITKDMQKNQKVSLDEFRFYGNRQAI